MYYHGAVSQDIGRVDLPPPVSGVITVGGQLVGGAGGKDRYQNSGVASNIETSLNDFSKFKP